MCIVKMPKCFKDANHIPPCKKPPNCPNQNDMTKIFSKHSICQIIYLQIYKQGSLIRHLRVFSKARRKPAHIHWFSASIHSKSLKFQKTSQKKKNQRKEDVWWPSCLLTNICRALSWELHYVYSVLSATPTPSFRHENQTSKCLCEPKVSLVYRFLRHHRRKQFCSVYGAVALNYWLKASDRATWPGSGPPHTAQTRAQPVSQNLAHKLSLQHNPQLHKKHEKYHRRQLCRELQTFIRSDATEKQVIRQTTIRDDKAAPLTKYGMGESIQTRNSLEQPGGNLDSKGHATFAVSLVRKRYLFLAMKQWAAQRVLKDARIAQA